MMRHGQALMLGLCAGLLAGCTTVAPVGSTAWLTRLRPWSGPTGRDVVLLDVSRLERPVADPYINLELWAMVDEQVVSLERKAVLEDNGFRVGQVGGQTPAGLLKLLTSETSPIEVQKRLYRRAGNPVTLVVGPETASLRFELRQDGKEVPVEVAGAECILSVVPSLTDDGRTRLRFTPQVRHGETGLVHRPAPDRSGWTLQEQQPLETYPQLSWEVTLAPNEYVIVGARADRPGTLGHQTFVRDGEAVPVQRLLAIRTSRAETGLEPPSSSEAPEEYAPLSKSPPLALQAALTTVRTR